MTDEVGRMAAEYRSLLVEWSLSRNSPKRANLLFRKNHELYKKLRVTEEGRNAIIRLLDDEELAVRLSAAIDSLEWVPERAVPILEEIEQLPNLYAIDAKYSLIAFRNGTLNLDW